ncbi:hypothetical protein JCM10207_000637 [Rhodosporidiobolus poonsookiae]
MPRFSPYVDPHPAPSPSHPSRTGRALQPTSIHNSPLTASGTAGKDSKGKGKARESGASRSGRSKQHKAWKDVDVLLAQSFSLTRITTPARFPFTPSSPSSDLTAFTAALRAFLVQQLALGTDIDDDARGKGETVRRVEMGWVDLPLFSKMGGGARPVLLEVERGMEDDAEPSTSAAHAPARNLSTFVFLPSASTDSFPVLLSKSPSASISALVHRYLSTRYDAILLPLRISPPAMLALLESTVQHRDTSFDTLDAELDASAAGSSAARGLSTNATFAFPAPVAKEGLSTLTLTLPPPLLPSLIASSPSSSFTAGLGAHLFRLTSLSLSSLFLVRFGAGRGTFVHSGQGQSQGEGGAKVKFFRGAEEGGEVKRVCEGIVRAAEERRRIGAAAV